MRQAYLAIARDFIGRLPKLTPLRVEEPSHRADAEPVEAGAPISIQAYQVSRPRCTECGFALSVVAKSTLCGRCVAKDYALPGVEARHSKEDQLRGEVLGTLDRLGYPALSLADARQVGPGLLAWGPVLREMGSHDLSNLKLRLKGTTPQAKDSDS